MKDQVRLRLSKWNMAGTTLAVLLTGTLLANSVVPGTITVRAAEADAGISATTVEMPAPTGQISLLGKYDSADTAAIKMVDAEAKTITFRNYDTGRDYTLKYDNTSFLYDENGRAISAKLLKPGQVVDVHFLKHSKQIENLVVSGDAFCMEGVRNYDLENLDSGIVNIDGVNYHVSPQTVILTRDPYGDGWKSGIAADILGGDELRVSGVGKELYAITVTQGHGYVSLSSVDVDGTSIKGGYLELGNRIIHRISDGMMLNVPEGTYELRIDGKGADYTREIQVSRDQETVIDTSVIEIEKPEEGTLEFEVVPADATVRVDGTAVSTLEPATFTYGLHSLQVSADGYETVTKYIHLGQPAAKIQITLEKSASQSASSKSSGSDDATEETTLGHSSFGSTNVEDVDNGPLAATTPNGWYSGEAWSSEAPTAKSWDRTGTTMMHVNPSSSKSASSASTGSSGTSSATKKKEGIKIDGYRVYVDAPVDAELYLDGDYVGVIPTWFAKVSGQHTITLRQDGYATKSYTINVDTDKNDKTYTFPAMASESGTTSADSSNTAGATYDPFATNSQTYDPFSAGTSSVLPSWLYSGNTVGTVQNGSTVGTTTFPAGTEGSYDPFAEYDTNPSGLTSAGTSSSTNSSTNEVESNASQSATKETITPVTIIINPAAEKDTASDKNTSGQSATAKAAENAADVHASRPVSNLTDPNAEDAGSASDLMNLVLGLGDDTGSSTADQTQSETEKALQNAADAIASAKQAIQDAKEEAGGN